MARDKELDHASHVSKLYQVQDQHPRLHEVGRVLKRLNVPESL